MEKLHTDILKIEFITGANFSYNLDKEFELISSNLRSEEQKLLKDDFDQFFKKGQILILNTFGGGILFLKVSEEIVKIQIESQSDLRKIKASVVYKSEKRRPENIKYKPDAGKIESLEWNIDLLFPNFYNYKKTIQKALILVIGKIVKRICEYGRTNFAYMKIENEFNIELLTDEELIFSLKVDIDKK